MSLVDKGAVPESDFVVLSKRIETEPEPDVTTETPESEIVALAKAMDSDTAYEAANALHLMAEMTQLGVALKRCKDRMSPEMKKAFDDLKSAMHDEPVTKNEPEPVVETPAEPVAKKTSDEQFAEALELLEKREQEKIAQADSEAVSRVLEKCDAVLTIAKNSQDALNERLNQFEKTISREQGKDDD